MLDGDVSTSMSPEPALTFDSHLRGPSFVMEPPSRLEFSNSSGGWLDCSASGSPQPSIDWLSVDGTSVGDVSGIRRVLRNGTLFLQPFAAQAYRQDIHSTVYRCVASNNVGRIISRDVQVRAVVTQAFKVDVEVIGAARGCTAVLKCIVPNFVKDLVRIISWVQEPTFFIYPSLQGDGKFHQLPSGELLIHNLEFSDQFPTYRCRTMHRLSRQVVVSSPANVRITEHRGIVSPVIVENSGTVTVAQDEGAALICIAQGCPAPEYRWYNHAGLEPSLIIPGPRVRQLGPVLAIEAVTSEDGGPYRCSASNAGGESSAELRLIVSTPLHVEISPPLMSVHMGGTAEFRCVVSAQSGGPHLVTWYKDGRQLPSTGRGSSETLIVNNIGREDRGMYQCVVRRAEGDTAQAAAELQLGDAPPILLYSFIEQTLQQGPAVSLKCSASGNPTPQISWSLDGFPLPSHGRFVIGQYVTVHGDVISHVNISQVMVEDGGEYTCTAENRAGKTSHSARLNIYGMPYIRLIPKVTAVAGETLQLKCPVAGYPIEEIHWERGGRELPDDLRQKVLADGTLVINPVEKKADSGVYTCWARNKQGQNARRSGEVNVIVPPKVSPFYAEDTLHVGDRASLTCSVTKGDLPLTISWHKDGRALEPAQMMSITQVDQFTSILVIESLMQEHNGNYSCVVRNLAAEVSHTQQLVVNVPPIIEPFSFQDGLSEGMRTRTVCGVSKGDPPLVVSWLKDGQPLTPNLGVNVSALDPYSSLLSISSLDSRHSGDFTCVASNPASEVRYTAKLQVKVPPKWLVEPIDVSVERNRHVALHCQAQGVPTPTVTWKKATASKSGDYEEVRDHMYTKLLGNGTLLLQHVKEDREGYYLCQADNGIGTGIGKVIQLRVNSSPYFSAPSRLVTVKKGDTALLHCDVNGDKPISVIWLRGGKTELNPSTNYRVNVKQDVTPDGVSAELQIVNADAKDSGAYFCQASNMYGRDQQLVQLLVQEPPGPPQGLEAAMISSRSVNLKWLHKSGDSNEVFKFVVEYKEVDRSWHQIEFTENPLPYAALIEDLKPATKYTFHVIAEGPAGKSAPSEDLVLRTEPQRPAGSPLNPSARPISSTEILVIWSPPLPELRHGDIQGFNVGYRTASMGAYNFTSVTGDGEDGGELLLGGLAKYTRYTIVVQAFNEVGAGPLSEPVTAQTMEDVPSMPPEDVRCAALTSQSLQVSWQPPPTEHCNGLLQGYKLTYEPVLDDNWRGNDEMETRKTTALTTVITGLRKFTNYSLQVLAFTKVGDGVFTIPSYCQTEEDVPGAPADIKAVVSSPQSLKVSWLPPLDPNGVITKYNLYRRNMDGRQEVDNAKQTISSQHTVFEVKGIQSHIEYQFWVTASTRIGEGQSSKVVSQVATPRVPARIISFGGVVVRPWRSSVAFNCESVGTPRREWLRNEQLLKGGASHNQQLLDTGELILSNLQLSDAGNYSCQVDNGQGSDRISYNLVVQVPPSAPLLYVTSATSSSVLLHWKAGSNGGAAVSGFTLNYRKEHGNLDEIHLSRHATSFELKGLSCGTTYHLYLTAHNKIGSSPASHPLQARTQGHPPGVPSASSFITPNSTSVVLRLHVWPDNGCPILYFILQYRKATESQWTLVSNALKPQRRTSITGLTPATQYVVKLEAHNVAGFSTEEFAFMTLTKEGDIPPPDLMKQGSEDPPFYSDMKIVIPLLLLVLAIKISVVGALLCMRRRQNDAAKEQLDNQQNAEAQRERYYATIHKVALQAGEKIPETSEDISPYATFQLSEPSTLPQNTMLHSFMYHEHPMTEGCASPPPATSSVQRNSPYYNIQKFQSTKGHGRRRANRKNDVDSEDSESDQDQLTSSRTESSNQLDMKHKHNFVYHGAQSSTSSDISPMSEQKSLPRRNRNRWLAQGGRSGSQRQMLSHLSVAETAFTERPPPEQNTPDRPELSEAECDIDTLKKLKLGLRSSLWSRPSGSGQPSDYSIAV
ncbi:Down syndrome cell adhesion molecule-like protein Dscam2 [Anoplophora glabripennis]|uniref:Down syndrome cell adhesion molecule-like protein Dscam2 n=1 Tax=Anoplophora glabripennis TaxID=217634 RepID=UPI000874683C|nr:Down syndrome cell adhesion molecule-like protein Dscam2 [Anoplophora glabripennis]